MEFVNPTRALGYVKWLDRKESFECCVTDPGLFKYGILQNILHNRRNERCVPFERLWLFAGSVGRCHSFAELDEVFHCDKF